MNIEKGSKFKLSQYLNNTKPFTAEVTDIVKKGKGFTGHFTFRSGNAVQHGQASRRVFEDMIVS